MHFLKGLPIRSQLLILALTTGAITFCMYVITYFQVANTITRNNNEYSENILTQVKQTISQNCGLLGRILSNIAYNSNIQQYILNGYRSYDDFQSIDNFLYNIEDIQDGIIDIVILGNNGRHYFLKGMNDKVSDIINSMPKDYTSYYSGEEQVAYQNLNEHCFILAMPIYSIVGQDSGGRIGTAALVLDVNVLGLKVDKRFESSSTKFYLVDRNKIVYSSNDQTMIGKKLEAFSGDKSSQSDLSASGGNNTVTIGGSKWIVNIEAIPETGGEIVSVVSKDKLFESLSQMRRLAILIFLIAVVVISIPFLVISNNIIDPLKRMMEFMSTVKKDDFNSLKQRIKLKGYIEIETMAHEFNKLLDKVTELTDGLIDANTKLYETKLAKKRSELAYLKSQINPHFLYNTLETMKGTAIEEGAPNTMEMTKALGQIFRYSIKGDDIVKLSDELKIIKSYVKIQQIRFNNRIDVHYDFTDDVLELSIPKMILQPIVENAIFHGLEAKVGKGTLRIGGEIAGNNMYIWVRDDGVGIEIRKTEDINGILTSAPGKQETQTDNSHMGLQNVNNRIKLAFGEQYGLKLTSSPESGTEVLIKIPVNGRGLDV